jgi:hypothetical protein
MSALRGTEHLTGEQRELARALRQAARIVAHAALPAEYRAAAFCYVAPPLVAGAIAPDPPRRRAPADRCPETPRRSW